MKQNIELLRALPLSEEYFFNLINNNYSDKTLLNYKRDILVFALFLKTENISFRKLTKLDLIKFKDFLRSGKYLKKLYENKDESELNIDQGSENTELAGTQEISRSKASRRRSMYSGRLGSRSVNRMLSALRSYFRFLLEMDYEIPVPPDSIKLIKTEKKISGVADLKELVSIIEAPETLEKKRNVKYRNRAMMELLFATGMRISELINLNRNDLKLSEDKQKILDDSIFITGKGKKQRLVYMTERSKFYIERYLNLRNDDFEALFIPYRGTRMSSKNLMDVRVSTNYLQTKIKEYRTRLGVNIPTSAHSFRHGFATYLAENGANPASIQHLLGHESLQTTSRYVHQSDRVAKQSHKDFHPLKS